MPSEHSLANSLFLVLICAALVLCASCATCQAGRQHTAKHASVVKPSVTAHETFVIFVLVSFAGILKLKPKRDGLRMMNFLFHISSWIAPRWAMSAAIACALAFTVLACIRCLETENTRTQRAHRKKEKELRALMQKILFYARGVHSRFPTGDVVVGEKDLAEQLRKHPATVAVALNVLLGERKVQKAPLNGYWKLNVD